MTSHHKPRHLLTLIVAIAFTVGIPMVTAATAGAVVAADDPVQISEPVQIGEAVAIERPELTHGSSTEVVTTIGVSVAGVTIVRASPAADDASATIATGDMHGHAYVLIGFAVAAALAALFWQRGHTRANNPGIVQ